MAKRKRLGPPVFDLPDDLETKSAPPRRVPAPIADVAGDASAHAALAEVSEELHAARAEGRLVQSIDLSLIDTHHLVRDRMAVDDEEMQSLHRSLVARGQQTPIEVMKLDNGRYGLISGWRRVMALRGLGESDVKALVRTPKGADAAYVAMVEENEIRTGLSFYERARLAAEAARIGVFPDVAAAVAALYAAAPAPKRSKILNFVTVHAALDPVLKFPVTIPERLGLALAAAIEKDPGFAARLKDRLRKTPPQDAAAERAALEKALKGDPKTRPANRRERVGRELYLEAGRGRLVLSGKGLSDSLAADLREWLRARNA